MRGQWFIDGTWQPLEEEESNLIEQEHLNRFRGQQMQESFDMEVSKPVDGKEGKITFHNLSSGQLESFLTKNLIWDGFLFCVMEKAIGRGLLSPSLLHLVGFPAVAHLVNTVELYSQIDFLFPFCLMFHIF